MKKLVKSKRGVSNIISTLVIFTIMVSALGLAFSQIVPSLERFQTESDMITATNSFLSFDSEIKKLISAPDNSSSVIRYNVDSGILDLTEERDNYLIITSGGEQLLNYTYSPGEVHYRLEGNFKGSGGLIYVFGSPILLVYSINRTTQITNIGHQSFNGYKVLKLFYGAYMNIEKITDTEVEINFMIFNLKTTRTVEGQGEYFPIINTASKIMITKESQTTSVYDLGLRNDDLSIAASSIGFSQNIVYPIAPETFHLTLNIINVNIDFSTV
ncbi:MAG: hypothetical protein HeimAB125_03000 [Candidatus Heimdallarchaeota archaeon AB_125]|nr:MAG: hypothetical protein HeimAB125_03000 [Candidatus Heimdallarchaeota archaeon AB_125]